MVKFLFCISAFWDGQKLLKRDSQWNKQKSLFYDGLFIVYKSIDRKDFTFTPVYI